MAEAKSTQAGELGRSLPWTASAIRPTPLQQHAFGLLGVNSSKATRFLDYPVMMGTCRSNLPELRTRQVSSVWFIPGIA
jgi:hypothetical protein